MPLPHLAYEPNVELREITHGLFRKPTDSRYQVLARYAYRYAGEFLPFPEVDLVKTGRQHQYTFIAQQDRTNFAVRLPWKEMADIARDEILEGEAESIAKWVTHDVTSSVGRAMAPSPVGGVCLGGTGQTLEGLGLLDGVATDANGNLILLAQGGRDIQLPPLRLDDVVTVFRSVYLHGEGPTVTIDPDPENPTGAAMIIRHSEATDGTYVGWVLYQADQLMKAYNLGQDNITKQDVQSGVPGYPEVLNTIYFGGGQSGSAQSGGSWERFWIVPAAARRFGAAPDALTLFDVPDLACQGNGNLKRMA